MKDLQKEIENALKQVDIKSIVENEIKDTVRNEINSEIKRQISRLTEETVKGIIKTETDILLSQPIETDDGWGKKEKYPSFEELFKSTFRNKINNTYEVKKTIDAAVKSKVDQLYKEGGKTFMDNFKDYLDKQMLNT